MVGTTDRPQAARFEGRLGDAPARSFRGALERAGVRPYLLLGVECEGLWILDVSGVDGDGARALELVAIAPDQRRYTGVTRVVVARTGGERTARITEARLSGEGGEIVLSGLLGWVLEAQPARYEGELELALGGQRLTPARATLAPFNQGWRAQALFVPRPGETLVLDLRVPEIADAVWSGAPLALSAIHGSEDAAGEVQARTLQAERMEGRGSVVEQAFSVRFRGALRGADGQELPVEGRFTGAVSKE